MWRFLLGVVVGALGVVLALAYRESLRIARAFDRLNRAIQRQIDWMTRGYDGR